MTDHLRASTYTCAGFPAVRSSKRMMPRRPSSRPGRRGACAVAAPGFCAFIPLQCVSGRFVQDRPAVLFFIGSKWSEADALRSDRVASWFRYGTTELSVTLHACAVNESFVVVGWLPVWPGGRWLVVIAPVNFSRYRFAEIEPSVRQEYSLYKIAWWHCAEFLYNYSIIFIAASH